MIPNPAGLPASSYSTCSEPTKHVLPQTSEVFVGGLHPSLTSDDLKREMSQFGQVVSARIMCYKDGRTRGFGFVAFKTEAVAQHVVTLRFVTLSSCTVECKIAMSKVDTKELSEKALSRKLLVESPQKLSAEAVMEYFSGFGKIIKIRHTKGGNRKFAFDPQDSYRALITFSEESAVQACMSKGRIHSILDSAVAVSIIEGQTKIPEISTQEKKMMRNNYSIVSAARDNPELPFSSYTIAVTDKPKSSAISAGLREAIRSATIHPNIAADNIEFRLNIGATKQTTSSNTARQVRQLHRSSQPSLMLAPQ